MNRQYGKKFNINNATNINNDKCAIEILNEDNVMINNYLLRNPSVSNEGRGEYFDSFEQPCVFQTGNYGGFSSNIDNGSSIRQGKYGNILTHDGTKRVNPYDYRMNPPFKGAQTRAADTDVMSRLYNSEITHDKVPRRGVSIDRFDPLLPEVKKQIQNPKHLIPTFWVRGGMDTKTVIRNIDYLKTCGLSKN